jgi:glycosyltransferase involved in cell wall biosynthesis
VLADKIISLAKNRNLAKEFGLAARKRVEENFKIDKNVKAIEQIYMENIHMEQSHGA